MYMYIIVSKIVGFNIKTADGYASMMSDFERIVGLKYLKALHLNDSQSTLLTLIFITDEETFPDDTQDN